VQDPPARLRRDPEGIEQGGIDGGVAEPHPVVAQAGRVEGGAQDAQRLGRAVGRRRADELDSRLEELPRLPPLGPHAAVGVREVGEAQRRLGAGVARGHDAGDRQRHVRAQGEGVAALVEQLVSRARIVELRAFQRRGVLERRRVDLAVAARLEHASHRLRDRAQLAHLVGQHVAGSAGDPVGHRSGSDRI
jgi:hypothetical protein